MSTEPIRNTEQSNDHLPSELSGVDASLSSQPESGDDLSFTSLEAQPSPNPTSVKAKPIIETIPQNSGAQKDLRAQIDEVRREMGELSTETQDTHSTSAHQEDEMGLLPPEEGQDAVTADRQTVVARESLSDQPSESKRTQGASLGLDAMGDSQSPQPVSLTPAPKVHIDQSEPALHDDFSMNDPFESTVQLTSLPPADLDLIAHSPPTHVNLNEVPTPSDSISGPSREEGGIELSTPLPRLITSLPHQRQLP